MKTMIQLAILAVILTPVATFANPHGGKKHHPAPPIHRGPVPKPPKPPPKPTPTPTPTPPPGHHKHHRHHHQTQVVYVAAAAGSWPQPVVQNVTYTNTQPLTKSPATSLVLTTREFLQGRDLYRGQRVTVCGKVTQTARSMGGVDYVVLDGAVWCELPRDFRSNSVGVATDSYVTIVGLATGGWHTTGSADLVKCDRPF